MLTNEQKKGLEKMLEKERNLLERAEKNVETIKERIKGLIAAINGK